MFEPIDLGNPIATGIDNIGNILVEARKRQQAMDFERSKMLMQQKNIDADNLRADKQMQLQQDQFARSGKTQEAEEQRKAAADFQAIYEASGRDPAMARQMAKAHGYDIVDSPSGPVAVKSAAAPAAPTTPSPDVGPPATSPPPVPNPGVDGSRNFAGPPDLVPGQAMPPAAGQAASPPPSGPDGLEPFPGDPTAPSAPPTVAQQLQRAFQLSKGGRTFDVDPAAAKAAEDEKFAEQLKLKQAAPEARSVAATEEHRRQEQFKIDHPELRNEPMTFAEREKLANISGGYRVRAATAGAQNPLKVDAGVRQDLGSLEKAFTNFARENQLLIDSKTNKRLETAAANLGSGNAMQQREAAESLVSIFKGGGQVTKASQDLLLKHLSGIVGDAQTFVQHLATGHYGEQELGVLKQAADNALVEQNERMGRAQQAAVDTFGPGTGYENLGGNVNHKVRGFFRQFGLDTPDIYQQEAAPTAVLGSGRKPKATNPIAKAAKTSNLTGEDRAAVDWANSHKDDPRAKQILQLHGM